MTENMEQTVGTEATVGERQSNVAEKTYTQAEVDNIVKSRLAREKSKNKPLKADNEKEEGAEENSRSESEQSRTISPDELNNIISDDSKWFEENIGGDFVEFVRSEDFGEFMNGTGLSVRKGMEKFVKLKGKEAVKAAFAKTENGRKVPSSAGSVKDSGATNLKDYYSPDDVDNLTDRDMENPEIMKRVRQSMTKWK